MLKFRTLALIGAMLLPASLLLPSAAVRAEDKITIGVSLPQDDNPFYIGMLKGIRARAAEQVVVAGTAQENGRSRSGHELVVACAADQRGWSTAAVEDVVARAAQQAQPKKAPPIDGEAHAWLRLGAATRPADFSGVHYPITPAQRGARKIVNPTPKR